MTKDFIKAVNEFRTELRVPKSCFNKFGGYKYRTCEQIQEAAKPLLRRHGLLLTVEDTVEAVGTRVYVRATATLTDGESSISSTASAREEEAKKGMDASQITGTASSYARKYALNALFCIDDTKDADTDEYAKEQGATDTQALQAAIAQVNACNDENTLNACVKAGKAYWGSTDFQNAVKTRRVTLKNTAPA